MTDTPAPAARAQPAPSQPLPEGAWDCHAHVFGPFETYPLSPDTRYQPPLGTAAQHLAMLDAAGLAHGVLVHAAATGFDNRCTLDAVAAQPARLSAVAVIPEDAPDAVWEGLRAQGVRGIRFTEMGPTLCAPKSTGTLGLDALRRLAPRLRELGLHANVWARNDYIVQSRDWLVDSGVDLVFDHMGQFDVTLGPDDATFRAFLSLVDDAQAWVKLVTLRVSRQHWSQPDDVRAFHDALVARLPKRLVWGSDWPFISMDKDPPAVGRSLDLLRDWVGDEAVLRGILVDNPKVRYA